jgi:hypothetical protein
MCAHAPDVRQLLGEDSAKSFRSVRSSHQSICPHTTTCGVSTERDTLALLLTFLSVLPRLLLKKFEVADYPCNPL